MVLSMHYCNVMWRAVISRNEMYCRMIHCNREVSGVENFAFR
jgi:hypothetical protein